MIIKSFSIVLCYVSVSSRSCISNQSERQHQPLQVINGEYNLR